MLYFEVDVHQQAVIINEVESVTMHHQKAVVDGEERLYMIKRNKLSWPKDKGWFDRALITLYWHAKNAGEYVFFVPVEQVKKQQKKIAGTY